MIYWKYKFQFGKTTEEKFKCMQDIDYRIKAISYPYYLFLNFIKLIFGLIFIPIYIAFYVIQIFCGLVSILFEQITDFIYNMFYN